MEQKPKKIKGTTFSVWYFIIAFFLILWFQDAFIRYNETAILPYSEFQQLLKEDKVKSVVIAEDYIQGEFKEPHNGKKLFMTRTVPLDLAKVLDKYHIQYSKAPESKLLKSILSWVLPTLFFLGLWIFLMQKVVKSGGLGGQFMSVGKSKAKIYMEKDTKVSFKDVAGLDEAKEELKEVVNFLKNPKQYQVLGGRMPKGILLVGPPGTGKTLLAKAVAGEAGVPFFSTSGSEFVEMFVGVGAARVRDLFEKAREMAPCIIFIDELDALGRARGIQPVGANDEKEQTLNQLLVELDGFDSRSGIILLAATNRPEILDPALLRAGRFDRQVLVDKPDKKGRYEILKLHAKKVKLDPHVNLEKIAALTPGFTGADLENLVNEAALIATRRKSQSVTEEDLTAAIERIVAGLEKKNRLLNEFERQVVAHHEMGHAICTYLTNKNEEVHKVSIIPRGVGALGYTLQRPTEDRFLMTGKELEAKMIGLLGGRAAEDVVFNHVSTGAADDLARVTDIARSIVMSYGMDPEMGLSILEKVKNSFLSPAEGGYYMPPAKEYSEETAKKVDARVEAIIQRAYGKARKILKENLEVLKQAAEELLEKETLTESDLKKYFSQLRKVDV